MAQALAAYEKTIRAMSKKAAQELSAEIRASADTLRVKLLQAYEGKAHNALGFDDFSTYCTEYLQLPISERSVANYLTAARVERTLSELKSEEITDIPMTAAIELAKVPPTDAAEIYDTYKAAKGKDGYTPGQAQRELSRMVAKKVNELKPAVSEAPARKASKNGQANDAPDTVHPEARTIPTVKAATYDGSDEQKAIESGIAPTDQEGTDATASIAVDKPADEWDQQDKLDEVTATLNAFLDAFIAAVDAQDSAAMRRLYENCKKYRADNPAEAPA